MLAGLKKGVDGEVFNVVDDDLPSSRQFLRLYKRNVRKFKSFYVPHALSYALCYLWERYSNWSEGQLPPVFNRRRWHCLLEKDALQQRQTEDASGLDAKGADGRGIQTLFRSCRDGVQMLKVAIVGCGKIADAHASQIQRIKGCEIVGVCDRELADGTPAIREISRSSGILVA